MINKLVKFYVAITALMAPLNSFASLNSDQLRENGPEQAEIDQQIDLMTNDQRLIILKSLLKKLATEKSVDDRTELRRYFSDELLQQGIKTDRDPAPGKACE